MSVILNETSFVRIVGSDGTPCTVTNGKLDINTNISTVGMATDASVNALGTKIDKLSSAVDNGTGKIVSAITDTGKQLDTINKSLGDRATAKQVDTISSLISSTNSALSDNGKRLEIISTSIDNLTKSMTSSKQLDTLHADIVTTNGKTDTLHTDIATTNSKLDTLHTDITTSNNKLDTLHADIVTTNGKTDTLHTDITTTNSKLDTLHTDITTSNNKLDVISASMDSTGKQLSAINLSIGLTNKQLGTSMDASNSFLYEISKQMTDMAASEMNISKALDSINTSIVTLSTSMEKNLSGPSNAGITILNGTLWNTQNTGKYAPTKDKPSQVGVSDIGDLQDCKCVSIVGNVGGPTILSVQVSHDNINWFSAGVNYNAGVNYGLFPSDGSFHIFFQTGCRYIKLLSSQDVSCSAYYSAKN